MKHILFVFTGIVICMLAVTGSVVAQGVSADTDTIKETVLPQKVEYTLPYPGILSDNPLYALKNLRDKIMEMLIVDPSKKAEFFILQSDKDYSAGIFLMAKGKGQAAVTSLARGNSFTALTLSIAAAQKAQGKPLPVYTFDHLTKSVAKHIEVAENMTASIGQDQKGNLDAVIANVKEIPLEIQKIQ